MTLRTRTPYPSGATSGPGRSRLSDSRLRHRRGRLGRHGRPDPAGPSGRRAAHPEPDGVRLRAEALLGGSSPPRAVVEAGVEPHAPPEGAAGLSSGDAAGLSSGDARRLAVRERLPLWLQARCGMEPRTVAAVAVVLVAAVGFAAQQFWSARPGPVTAPAVVAPGPAPPPALAAAGAGATGATGAPGAGAGAGAGAGGAAVRIVVDVSGKVLRPGVLRLPAGSRVEDALAAAGGVRPGTDTTGLNRARVLVDGEQVWVGGPAPPPPGGPVGGGSGAGPLSLGTATVAQLDGLPGVGPVLAQHIVDFRTARGGFRSVEELRQVTGIGERRFADLRKLVRP
ncbi:helix-hairpin-helix domain-containing protein [Streptomyces sp. NPDC016562]|uniref:helix-hairpin-helix domain-containing protein n=1 Tax=Streptomyces sp. NPDC016562 TaxID=3364966 RepID=UPI003702FE94